MTIKAGVCSTCNGAGEITVEVRHGEEIVTCPDCGGTGSDGAEPEWEEPEDEDNHDLFSLFFVD